MTDQNEDPKIIVDDDWKQQVQREKEQLADATAQPDDRPEMQQMPPASFEMLVSSLATQAMASLGFFPDPETGQTMMNRPIAKHFIDTLSVIEEKTKGNLEARESELLTQTLHQLRMVYVGSESADNPDNQNSRPEDQPKSSIELP